MSFTVGETVGPYRIVEQLGHGGMATVFKAYHAALDRYVALKVLHPAFMEDPNFLARFQREAKLVARLDHPNIVPIYDYAEHEGRPYLVMKFIEGETLKARLGRGPLTSPEVVAMVAAVGKALAYAHKHGILHRDIKPSNVLISATGDIYLADFGLARIAQAGESTLTSDMIVGTPQYISPEQAMGKKDLDEGTDIYSFGVMLYELVVGKVPFSADTPFSIIHDHIYTPLPMPRAVNLTVAPDIERVLLKALAKERADRYPDVAVMVEAFQQAWAGSTPPDPAKTATFPVAASPEAATIPPESMRAPTPTPTPVGQLAVDSTPIPVAAADATVVRPKRRIPWMWIAIAVIAFLCCTFTFLAFRGNRLRDSADLLVEARDNSPAVLATAELPDRDVPPEAVEQALERIEANPDDPNAYLQLAHANLDLDRTEEAHQALSSAQEVSEDPAFFWDACRQLAERQEWLMAARMCVDAGTLMIDDEEDIPPDMRTLLHEVIYKAAKDPVSPDYFEADDIAYVDEAMAYVAQTRYLFYSGDHEQAWTLLEELNTVKPGMPETLLLQAEFHAMAEPQQPGEARRAIDALMGNPGLDEWMRLEAEYILTLLP
ncbi:MAG: protein kinase [Anaerolineales bacterium]|nr:protein kinase [Anaerolineales bacterium]